MALRWNYDWDSKTTLLTSSFGAQRSRQVGHDHINFSTGGRIGKIGTDWDRKFSTGTENLGRKIRKKVTHFLFTLDVCTQVLRLGQMMILTKSFISTRTRSCVGEIFFSMLPGVANVNPGYFSHQTPRHKDEREKWTFLLFCPHSVRITFCMCRFVICRCNTGDNDCIIIGRSSLRSVKIKTGWLGLCGHF